MFGSTYLLKDGKKLVAKINIYIYPSEATNENLREQFNAFKIAVNRNATNAPNLIPEFLKLENEKVAVSGIRSVFDYNRRRWQRNSFVLHKSGRKLRNVFSWWFARRNI
jgi:hypothetical protein